MINFFRKNLLNERVSLPAHIHHVAYLMKDPPNDSPLARKEFQEVLSWFQIGPDQTEIHGRFGYGVKTYPGGDLLLVLWRLHTEYYSYQTWHIPRDPARRLSHGPMDLPGYDFPVCPMGARITSIDILIEAGELPAPEPKLRKILKGPEIYGSRILNGSVYLFTDFMEDQESRIRFLVSFSDPSFIKQKVDFIVESVTFLENYSKLILMPLDEFNQNMNQIYLLEKDQVMKREEIAKGLETSSPARLKEWLMILTRSLAGVNRIGDRVRYNLASAFPYDSILRATLEGIHEVPLAEHPPLSHYIHRKVRGIADGYQRLIDRINALTSAFEGSIAILRTRVEMAMEEQNLALLKSVDETTKNQAHLQQTVEGLSVIVLAYYITGIANYFFKGLEEWGYLKSPYLATEWFIPVSFLIAFGLVYRVKRGFRRSKKQS